METRSKKNTPRAGPSQPVAAGESRTAPPSRGGGLPQVYGGGNSGVPSVAGTDEGGRGRRRGARKRRKERAPDEDHGRAKRVNSPLLMDEEEVEEEREMGTDEEIPGSDDSEYQDPHDRGHIYARRAETGNACRSQTPLTSEWEEEDLTDGPEDVVEAGTVKAGFYHECSRHLYRVYRKRRQRAADNGEDGEPEPENIRVKTMARVLNSKAKVVEIVARVAAKRAKLPPGEPSARTLGAIVQDDVAILLEVTKSHGRQRGVFAKAIELATASLTRATNQLVDKASDYECLQERVADMRAEIDQLRQAVAKQSRPSQVLQTPQATQTEALDDARDAVGFRERTEPPLTIGMIGAMMDAKIAGIADRLLPEKRLRPPLEADKSTARDVRVASKITERRGEVEGPPRKAKRKPKKKRTTTVPPVADLPAVPSRAAPSVAPAGEPRKDSWATVAARKAPPKRKDEPRSRPSPPSPRKAKKGRGAKCRRRRTRTKTEAVTLTIPEGSQVTYAEALTTAKGAVKLEELGIAPEEMRSRRTRTGGMLYELSGPECGEKADRFAESLGASLGALGVRVLRPTRTRELKVLDLDDATEVADVAKAVASAGGCAVEAVKVGSIRRAPGYLGVASVRCPLAAAQRLLSSSRLVVGWSRVRVVALEARAEFCFCCLECGHVGAQCPNKDTGRGARCFKCSEPGHTARECRAPERRCPLCVDMGLPHAHRLGSGQCAQAKGGRIRRPPSRSGEAQGVVVATTPMDTATERAADAGSVTRAAPAKS